MRDVLPGFICVIRKGSVCFGDGVSGAEGMAGRLWDCLLKPLIPLTAWAAQYLAPPVDPFLQIIDRLITQAFLR